MKSANRLPSARSHKILPLLAFAMTILLGLTNAHLRADPTPEQCCRFVYVACCGCHVHEIDPNNHGYIYLGTDYNGRCEEIANETYVCDDGFIDCVHDTIPLYTAINDSPQCGETSCSNQVGTAQVWIFAIQCFPDFTECPL